MPPCESLLEGRLSARPRNVEGLANYYNDNDCIKYLTHPPVLLPVASTSTLGEDNDRHDQLHHHKWRAFGGGEVLDDCDPDATDNSPNDSIDWPEWGTQWCYCGAWSGLLECVPLEVSRLDPLFHVPLLLQRLWCCHHHLTSCGMNALKEKMRGRRQQGGGGGIVGRKGGRGGSKGS
jgi:hypothetical protein